MPSQPVWDNTVLACGTQAPSTFLSHHFLTKLFATIPSEPHSPARDTDNTITMDIQLTAILSASELVALTGLQRVTQLAHEDPSVLIATFLTYFTIQYALLKFYRIVIYPNFISPLRNLPGPKVSRLIRSFIPQSLTQTTQDNLPCIGQFMAIFKATTASELQVNWANTWPRAPFIRYLNIGNEEVLVMNTPEAHKAVLQTYCYDFVKPKLMTRAVGEIIGTGVFFADGVHHRRIRKILQGKLSFLLFLCVV